ncbi:hypothetical protein LTS18_010173, partial [Coniosporium uncinatum]
TSNGASLPDAHYPIYKAEEVVRQIRQIYGDTLPKDSLSAEELGIYERLYGPPITQLDGRIPMRNENGTLAEKQEPDNEAVLLKEGSSGDLEEVEVEVEEDVLDDEQILHQLQQEGVEGIED